MFSLFREQHFVLTWLTLTALGAGFVLVLAGPVFYFYYQTPTFERWRHKTNPYYPSAQTVWNELRKTLIGLATATLCPSVALYLCDERVLDAPFSPSSFLLSWLGVDLWEFLYHRLGHTTTWGWEQHRSHHQFWNPTPFAVIADDWPDQLFRSLPLLILPILFPAWVSLPMLFLQFGVFFYAYGVFLHWGHEGHPWITHQPIFNTSYHHYVHHSIASNNRPCYTGFFFQLWDRLWNSQHAPSKCQCVFCEPKVERTAANFALALDKKPDYLGYLFSRAGG